MTKDELIAVLADTPGTAEIFITLGEIRCVVDGEERYEEVRVKTAGVDTFTDLDGSGDVAIIPNQPLMLHPEYEFVTQPDGTRQIERVTRGWD